MRRFEIVVFVLAALAAAGCSTAGPATRNLEQAEMDSFSAAWQGSTAGIDSTLAWGEEGWRGKIMANAELDLKDARITIKRKVLVEQDPIPAHLDEEKATIAIRAFEDAMLAATTEEERVAAGRAYRDAFRAAWVEEIQPPPIEREIEVEVVELAEVLTIDPNTGEPTGGLIVDIQARMDEVDERVRGFRKTFAAPMQNWSNGVALRNHLRTWLEREGLQPEQIEAFTNSLAETIEKGR